jgi:hypothetical protein
MPEERQSSCICGYATIAFGYDSTALLYRIGKFTSTVMTVDFLAEPITGRDIGRGCGSYSVALRLLLDWRPLHSGYRFANVESELSV